MKKTMVIAIVVAFLIAIVAVNFFGLSIKDFEGYKYVERIEYELTLQRETETEIKERNVPNDDRIWYTFKFQGDGYHAGNLTENPNAVFISCHVYPEDAKNKRVNFSYDKEQAEGVCIVNQEIGTIYFLKKGGVTITLEPADHGNAPRKKLFICAT